MERIDDPQLLGILNQRILRTAELFDLSPATFPSPAELVWRPNRSPQFELFDPGIRIFLTNKNYPQQARYQIAHEVVHGTLSPTRVVFDWVQEMFAVLLAVWAMEEAGMQEYADGEREVLRRNATDLDVQAMLQMKVALPIPPPLYGRAFLVGTQLNEAIGWERLKLLGASFDVETGKHDVRTWLAGLERSDRSAAECILKGQAALQPDCG